MTSLDKWRTECQKRVARGVAFLDEREPGWRERVNIETLDVSSGLRCPLAQGCGTTFMGGMMRHGLTNKDAEALGFYINGFDSFFSSLRPLPFYGAIAVLDEVWRTEVGRTVEEPELVSA